MASTIYVLKMTFRKPSVWAGTILSALLATGLLFGVFMSIDYAHIALVRQYTDSTLVDFSVKTYYSGTFEFFNKTLSSYSEFVDGLEAIEYVEKVELTFDTKLLGFELTIENKSSSEILKAGYSPVIPVFLIQSQPNFDGISINGSLSANSIAIGRDLAKYLNAKIGSQAEIKGASSNTSLVLPVSAIVNVEGEFYERYSWVVSGAPYYSILLTTTPGQVGVVSKPKLPIECDPNYGVILYFEHWEDFSSLINASFGVAGETLITSGSIRVFILLDRSIIDPFDLSETSVKIYNTYDKVSQYLQNEITPGGFYIENHLGWTLSSLNLQLLGIRISSLLALIPILILSVVLAIITNWILVNKRKRELGLIRIRGMSTNQVFLSLIIETLIIGILAGLLSIAASYFASYLITKVTARVLAKTVEPSVVLNEIYDDYIIPIIIASIILCLLSIVYPANKVSKLDLLSSISEYTPEIEAEVKVSKVLLALVIISFYGILETLLAMPTYRFIMSEVMKGRYFIALLLIVYLPVYLISIIGGPFILAYGCSKLIAAHSDKLSKVLEYISRPFSGDFSKFAVEQFIRKKARAYKVILLITLTLTFGIYYTIGAATARTRTQIELEISIGADVKITFLSPVSLHAIESINGTIYNVSGVRGLSYMAYLRTQIHEITKIDHLVIIDKAYADVGYFKKEYIDGLSLSEFKNTLTDPTKVLLPIRYKYTEGCELGSTISFKIEKMEELYNFTIAGYIKWLPGRFDILELQISDAFGISGAKVAFVGLSIVDRIQDAKDYIYVDTILIDIEDSLNKTQVAESIGRALEKWRLPVRIQVYEKALEEANNNWLNIFNYMISDAVFYLAIVMSIIGMTLTMATSIIERRREIALLRVRGASQKDLLGMIIGEAAIITILGYLLGIALALAFTYGSSTMSISAPQLFMGVSVEFPPGYIMTIPRSLYLIIGVAFIAFLLSAIIPLLKVVRSDISQELRIAH